MSDVTKCPMCEANEAELGKVCEQCQGEFNTFLDACIDGRHGEERTLMTESGGSITGKKYKKAAPLRKKVYEGGEEDQIADSGVK